MNQALLASAFRPNLAPSTLAFPRLPSTVDDMRHWPTVASSEAFHTRLFKIRRDRLRAPINGTEHDFFVIEADDWVNVIALTPQNDVVLVRQYRHGVVRISTEIPGGVVERGELPLDAAKRELAEETGYHSDDWAQIGVIEPNPAIQNNRSWTFVARNARLAAAPQPDAAEELEVDTCPLVRLPELLRDGTISHALVLCAFTHFALHGGMTL